MTQTTNDRPRFASIDEVITRAMATDGTVSPPPPVQAPAPGKVRNLIAAWSQRAEATNASAPRKSSLTGLKHLGPKHVQARIQQFTQPASVTSEISKTGGGIVKQRVAALEDVKAACQYALERQQNDRPRQGQPGARPTVVTPPTPTPSPDREAPTPSPTPDVTSPQDSIETESKALMREGMDIMSSASRHYHDWHSDMPTPDLHPMVRAPTDFQRETGLSVGVSAIPPLTGTARVFGTRRYRRDSPTEERLEIQAATKVTRRIVSDTHWLKIKEPTPMFGFKRARALPKPPARLLEGAQSLRKPTSQLPIAKYYTNNYQPGNNDEILPLRIHKPRATNRPILPPTSALTPLAPLGNQGGFTEYKVAGRFGILGARPRVAKGPRFGENLAPTKTRSVSGDTPTFPRVPKLRRRTPPQVTVDLFNKIWPGGARKPST
ncbi:hypothetical protein TWF481_008460 [Arthrobotrys musiformis]|uniref:Uncharacterized protein n=1 Tax=Arthrobotrys musiformis TaxID=47236 RepID=A0AAV9W774_9PEZI